MNNKVKYGLKNVYWAPLTFEDGLPVYGTPVRYPGAVELTLTPRGELYEFHADDSVYFTSEVNDGYDGTFTAALVPESFKAAALGETTDDNGVAIETTNDKGQPFALIFSFAADVKSILHILYKCTASRPTVGSSTKTNTIEAKTEELTFVASGLDDGTDKPKVKASTTSTTDSAVYNAWTQAVYLPSIDAGIADDDELPA